MKKTFAILFTALGLAACFALFLCFFLLGPSAPGANEVLSKPPKLLSGEGQLNDRYLQDAADYYGDHFHFRQEMIDAYDRLHTALFSAAPGEDVLLGSEGWLYYGRTLTDYLGTAPMTEYELCAAADNLRLMQEYCSARGMAFAFAPVPNKNTLYDANMPDFGVKSTGHDLVRLTEKLTAAGVSTADLFAAFAGQDEVLYFAHDSHWTGRGAALGADCINAALGRTSDYFSGPFTSGAAHQGDLFEMLYPTGSDGETDTVYAGALNFRYAENSAVRPDSITIRTESDGAGVLTAYRDSFGNSLYPYLAAGFGQATFSRSVSYNLAAAAESGSDAVVIELVERNLGYLISNLPVMPAPAREISVAPSEGRISVQCRSAGGALPGHTLWSGLQRSADADSPVYLLTAEGAFECFRQKDGAFAAYLSENIPVTGVAYYINGTLRVFSC